MNYDHIKNITKDENSSTELYVSELLTIIAIHNLLKFRKTIKIINYTKLPMWNSYIFDYCGGSQIFISDKSKITWKQNVTEFIYS